LASISPLKNRSCQHPDRASRFSAVAKFVTVAPETTAPPASIGPEELWAFIGDDSKKTLTPAMLRQDEEDKPLSFQQCETAPVRAH
jgi:hypothetical protein